MGLQENFVRLQSNVALRAVSTPSNATVEE